MGFESEDKTIGDTTYRVTQLPAGKARKLLVRLFKVAGPAFSKILSGLSESALAATKNGGDSSELTLGDVEISTLGDGLASFAYHLEEADLEYTVDAIFGSGSVEYETPEGGWIRLTKATCDLHFAGKLDEQFKVLAFAFKVNYASFFAGSGAVTSFAQKLSVKRQAASGSPSPKPSIGQSGE